MKSLLKTKFVKGNKNTKLVVWIYRARVSCKDDKHTVRVRSTVSDHFLVKMFLKHF